jgi:hypothetical protein
MIHIKKFIDKIALMEARQGRDVVLPLSDARALRDEITKLLLDQKENTSQQPEVIEVVMKGGKF